MMALALLKQAYPKLKWETPEQTMRSLFPNATGLKLDTPVEALHSLTGVDIPSLMREFDMLVTRMANIETILMRIENGAHNNDDRNGGHTRIGDGSSGAAYNRCTSCSGDCSGQCTSRTIDNSNLFGSEN